MRTTKGNVESAFKYLCQALNKRIATRYNDVGAWQLDHVSGSGYIIEEIVNVNGAVTHPLASQYLKAESFYDACWFAIRAIDIVKGETK